MENNCNYPKSFVELVNEVNDKKNQFYGQYIGVGNPNAKILIIGKESAIDLTKEEKKRQYEREVVNNYMNWKDKVAFIDVDKGEQWKKDINAVIDPMYPYRGQRFVKYYIRKKDGAEIGRGGTSTTWYNYQKIINRMESISLEEARKSTICFHEYCFSTELSSESAEYSKEADPKKRKESIKRNRELLKLPFYQQFPIVIVAAGHYPKEFGIDLEELFGVKWDGKTIDRDDNCKLKRNWLNVHLGNQPKLLIHTNQLSINITDELLRLIAEKCDEFAKSNNVKL